MLQILSASVLSSSAHCTLSGHLSLFLSLTALMKREVMGNDSHGALRPESLWSRVVFQNNGSIKKACKGNADIYFSSQKVNDNKLQIYNSQKVANGVKVNKNNTVASPFPPI